MFAGYLHKRYSSLCIDPFSIVQGGLEYAIYVATSGLIFEDSRSSLILTLLNLKVYNVSTAP